MEQEYYSEGDIVREKSTGRLWKVVGYKQVFGDHLNMVPTEYVVCRSLDEQPISKTFHHNELEFVKAGNNPYIVSQYESF